MNYLKYGIGIDMAKDSFDACLSVIDTAQVVTIKATSSFANNVKGFSALLSWSLKHFRQALPAIYLAEATGIYHEHLAWYLFDHDCKVVVVLPNKAKKYKESLGLNLKQTVLMQKVYPAMPVNSTLSFGSLYQKRYMSYALLPARLKQ